MKYQTYAKYKPSGIEWIGEVPVEWESRNLKHVILPYNPATKRRAETALLMTAFLAQAARS